MTEYQCLYDQVTSRFVVGNGRWLKLPIPVFFRDIPAFARGELKTALSSWSKVCQVDFDIVGRREKASLVVDFDGNVPDAVLGYTELLEVAGDFPKSFEIRKTRIVVNEKQQFKNFKAGLRTLFRHELGHCLGIGHSDKFDAVMSRFVRKEQELKLTPDDIAAGLKLYPKGK